MLWGVEFDHMVLREQHLRDVEETSSPSLGFAQLTAGDLVLVDRITPILTPWKGQGASKTADNNT